MNVNDVVIAVPTIRRVPKAVGTHSEVWVNILFDR